jgi:hypothetical protein
MSDRPVLNDAALEVSGRVAVLMLNRDDVRNARMPCASFQGALQKTEDHLEALAAFFEKRNGQYKGR